MVRRWGFAASVIAAVSLALSLHFKAGWLWMDEVLSMTLITDPSLAHLNHAVASGMDANPPLFPNLYWMIGHVCSLRPGFLRDVSIVLFAVTLYGFNRFVATLIGTARTNFLLITLMVGSTYLNLTLATQVRAYALFYLIAGWYFAATLGLALQPERYTRWALHFGAAVALLFCHNFGLFYLAASAACFVLLALWSRRKAYLAALTTHLLALGVWFILWYPRFAIQVQAGKPHSWIPRPTVSSFFLTVGELAPSLSAKLERLPGLGFLAPLRFIVILGLFGYVAIARARRGWNGSSPARRAAAQDPAYLAYLLSGGIYCGVLVITVVVSLFHTSVLLSRYLWPSQLLVMYQLIYAYYFFARSEHAAGVSRRWSGLLAAYAVVWGGFLFYQSRKVVIFSSAIVPYLARLDPRWPIFVPNADYFLPLWYARPDLPIRYLLDWRDASREQNVLSATVEYKILESVRTQYGVTTILPEGGLTPATYPHFYYVQDDSVYLLQRFIAEGRVRVVGEIPVPLKGHRVLECTFAPGR